jgi:epoxide hydrolase 4
MAQDSNLTRRVVAHNVELSVTVHGDDAAPPVIFLHGFPETARGWRHQLGAVHEAGFTAWAPDLRGYGLSDRPRDRDAYHLPDLMLDVAALVRATGHPRAHIVGHDWGGIIAWSFAGHYRTLVDKLVILNAPHLQLYRDKVWRSAQFLRSWYVGLFQLPGVPERLLSAADFAVLRRVFTSACGRSNPFNAEDIEEAIAPFRVPGALTAALNYYRANISREDMDLGAASRIAAPTLVLWGDQDPALGGNLLVGLGDVAPKVRVVHFPQVGHWVQHEAPADVNRFLIEFLRRDRDE